ncbi:uncharacterized protein LOC106656199 isoform X1 [Trichogramma pretiosum]|uniref:uncharacterized protein LOC106656199 isoform X1 n=1 Tax=Trichogramma pretiosum TaxID=7493 RepID=UPI0006C963D8|nr:uncharacterized protein LOC106656199 isoform X1 [Trichogramma pretiosum]XP_014232433.1 uncharacterized protein LOC106656199 isoform X1 [Trichogramma pretiosum]XP_023317323.1 uncharacterized protein LOC106656199 isoform X1 [Trichogramma pretiosum]
MADRNRNFLRDSVTERQALNKAASNNNNLQSAASSEQQQQQSVQSPPKKKEGIYAKKDNSNYQRFVDYSKDTAYADYDESAVPVGVEKKGPAPLVGWQNGSPTVLPSSPEDNNRPQQQVQQQQAKKLMETPSESSGIGRDDEDEEDDDNTENLSSIADERAVPSTPGLTIDKSLESFSQDADLSLTTSSPGSEQEFELNKRRRSSISEETLTSPTTTNRNVNRKLDLNLDNRPVQQSSPQQGILLKRQYSESADSRAATDLERLEKSRLASFEKDSIDGSSTMLEVYDEEEDDEVSRADGGKGGKKKKPRIPDGGWGWIVVLSSLVISMIADGVSFSFGLLYIEFLHEFEASKSTTAWIGSLFMAVPLLSGPVMSALVDRYGCRRMTICGGLIAGTGFVLSSYARSIVVMYMTFGVIAGLGLGLCYVTAVVSIAFWFDKKRTLAVGLGACGTGIGTFVYAPMTTFFIEEYGWRGCVLLLAGTFFNMIVCGTVMRDPEWWVQEQRQQHQLQSSPRKGRDGGSEIADRSRASPCDPAEDFPGVDELRRLMKSGQAPEYLLQNLRTSTEARITGGGNPAAFRSVVNLPTFVKQSEKVPMEVLESLSSNSRLYNVILENYPSLLLCRSSSDKKLDGPNVEDNKSGVTMSMRLQHWLKKARDKTKQQQQQQQPQQPQSQTQTQPQTPTTAVPAAPPTATQSRAGSIHASSKVLATRRMSRKDLEEMNPLLAKEVAQAIAEAERAKSTSRHHVPGCGNGVVRTDSLPWLRRQFSTNTHYFKDIRVHRNSVMYRGAVLNLHKYRLRASSCPNIYRNSMTTLAIENEEKWYSELVDLLKGMMDFSMFSELHFLLLSLSTILLFTWFIVPYFYLAEHLTRQGYPESKAANLLSYIGITNTIGMIGLGWAGDQPWMNVTKTYTCCLIACGISTILMPVFTHNHYALIVTSCCFGLFFASNFSFTPVILVEIIPLERFTTAYGLSLLCQGIGNLLGPPLAGWIFDMTGRWDLSFVMAGGWIIVSGMLMSIIPYTKNRKIWGSGPVECEKERQSYTYSSDNCVA